MTASSSRRAKAPTDAPTRGTSPALPSPFPPIAEYAILSNCHTGALVAPDGSVDWLCIPRFDSPSVFGSLLDREAGMFRFGPFGINVPTARQYVPGTNVARDDVEDAIGLARRARRADDGPGTGPDVVTPHTRPPMDEDADHRLVRVGDVPRRSRRDRGRLRAGASTTAGSPATWSLVDDHGHVAEATGRRRDAAPRTPTCGWASRAGGSAAATCSQAGETVYCALSWAPTSPARPTPPTPPPGSTRRSTSGAAGWTGRGSPTTATASRSSARPSPSRASRTCRPVPPSPPSPPGCPRRPGGERNWDYRYSWIRDSTFTLQALHWLNLDWEADEFMQFVADLEPNDDGGMQIMYGIDGRRDLRSPRSTTSAGTPAPVRCGSATAPTTSARTTSSVPCSTPILLHSRRSQRLPRRLWPLVQAQATCATKVWKEPDQGIWEARGKPQHYVSSKLMCWVALDRASHLAGMRGDHDLRDTWRATADEIRADVLDQRRQRARRPPPALRHRSPRRLDAPGAALRLPRRRRRSGPRQRRWRSPTS